MGSGSGKKDCDPFNLNDAPEWAGNALAEVVKIVMPGKKLPTAGEWDMELLGEFMGRLQAFGKLYGGEIPMGPEQQAELDRYKKNEASQPKSKEITVREKILAQDMQAKRKLPNKGSRI